MKHTPDEILIKALELREKGQAPEQIFAAFPEAAGELRRYFELAADLRSEAGKIAPPSRELLRGALRRAAAARNISDASVRPPARRLFGPVLFGLRVAAPILAVLLIVAFVDRSRFTAPGPGGDDQIVSPVPESTEAVNLAQDAAGPGVDNRPGPAAPTGLMSKAIPPGQPVPPAASTMVAPGDTGAAVSAPASSRSPAAASDEIAGAYIVSAGSEQAFLADVSIENQAVRGIDIRSSCDARDADVVGAISRCWTRQDAEVSMLRENTRHFVDARFVALEDSLAGAPDSQKQALATFRIALQDASAQRQLATDIAMRNFRSDTEKILRDGSGPAQSKLDEFRILSDQYAADLSDVADAFEAEVGDARAAFKASLAG